jgi:tetratricopeptide (TPR) repeat protein
VLAAAERWQRLNRSRDADLAIGEAQLQLGRPRLARNAVQPHVAGAIASPATSIPTLRLWCGVLIAERQVEEARKLLEPHLASSEPILDHVWIHLAAYNLAPETPVAWLRTALAPAGGHGQDSLYALANAWFELALRDEPGAKGHLVEARTILDGLAADSPASATLILLGRVCGHMKDYDSARSAFVAAAEQPEAKPEALRGLALIAITSGADPGAAVAAARRAVEASGPNEPMSMRLLGDALIAAAEAEPDPAKHRPLATEAAGLYKKILGISGESLLVLDRMARAYTRAGDIDLAIEAYERLVALPAGAMSAQQLAATQNNFACALLTKTDTESITHARQLALAASGVLPVGAVFDTLGAAEAALGNKAAAVEAFRHSLKLRPGAPATAVKLAELLAPGTESQRDEARKLVADTDAAMAATPAALTPDLLERFNRVRGVLGSN